MTSKDFRTIIEYNNLQTIADDLQVSEQYKILLKGIEDGKTTIDIAKELEVSRSRVDQMYWQYVVWCRRYTKLYYFKDVPPITEDMYEQIPARLRHHEDTLKEAISEMRNEK